MNIILRFAAVLALLLGAAPAWGQGYNPDNPAEPGTPPHKVMLQAWPAGGGSLSGSGKYTPGDRVTVRAYNNTGFVFVNWTDAEGNVVASTPSHSFTMPFAAVCLTANYAYRPGNPEEPVPGTSLVYYRLSVAAGAGGSVSGGGKYREGTAVTLSASPQAGFNFVKWTNEEGETVSENRSFHYTTQGYAETLTAHFAYNPGSPDEPDEPVLMRTVEVVATDGGTVSSGGRWLEGEWINLYAYCNAGYTFGGWYIGGVLYSDQTAVRYLVGNASVVIEARFIWDPSAPGEPAKPSDKQYAFYLMSAITYPGHDVECPLYFTSLDPIGDMSFQLTFPAETLPDWATLQLTDKGAGYTHQVTPTGEPGVYQVRLTGGTLPPGNACLFTVTLRVPEQTPLGADYQVKINQVSITQTDLSTATASTRNGRVYVYRLGDTNGDGLVDVTDRVNMSTFVLSDGEENDTFITEVSDVNEDGEINVNDTVGISNILLEQ